MTDMLIFFSVQINSKQYNHQIRSLHAVLVYELFTLYASDISNSGNNDVIVIVYQ